jgi:hypothetical protein
MTGSNPVFLHQTSTTNTQQVGGVHVPFHYELWSDGIFSLDADAVAAPPPDINVPLPMDCYAGRERVSFRPIWISQMGLTIDTQEPLLELSFFTLDGQRKSVWLNRGQITDHAKLAALGADGLPVDSVGAKRLLVYLRAQEALNAPLLPTVRVGHRTGPYILDGYMGWLIGRRWIGQGDLASDPRSNQRYVNAFSTSGDAQEWMDKWRELRNVGWVPRFLIGATFAPPLLRYAKCRTFILHHWGDSSHGKTATAMFALSAWGNPELLYSSMNRTAISLTEVFKHYTDLPVLYDEKQVSTVTSEELIYSICTGSGRERGHKDGGLRQDKPTWLTIARTTGEVPLITDGDVGGQFNRVLQIHSVAFAERRQAESIYPFVQGNYGHAGPAFLEQMAALVNNPQGYASVLQLFKELREALVNRVGMDTNHAAYGAIIATAQTLAEAFLLEININEAKEQALDDATEALRETAPKKQLSYAEKALSKLRDHWVANPFLYADDTSAEGRERSARIMRMVGVETDWGMALIPHEANDILIKAGYAPERVWRDFHNKGWLVTDGEGALTTINLRSGRSPDHPVYFIKREVFCTDSVRQTKLRLISGGEA